jgi:hypothetical protein
MNIQQNFFNTFSVEAYKAMKGLSVKQWIGMGFMLVLCWSKVKMSGLER